MLEITKKIELESVNNDMTTYKKYLVYGKFFNDDKTRSRRFKFVATIFNDDIFEYLNVERCTKKEYNRAIDELIYFTIEPYCNNYNRVYELIDYCNGTIQDYNRYIRRY